jgi:hypothetical protein
VGLLSLYISNNEIFFGCCAKYILMFAILLLNSKFKKLAHVFITET